jgi:hypothetical protein
MSSVSFGMRYPFSRKAVPKALSFGKTVWQVWQLVSYLRAKAGMASARGATSRTMAAMPGRVKQATARRTSDGILFTSASRGWKDIALREGKNRPMSGRHHKLLTGWRFKPRDE